MDGHLSAIGVWLSASTLSRHVRHRRISASFTIRSFADTFMTQVAGLLEHFHAEREILLDTDPVRERVGQVETIPGAALARIAVVENLLTAAALGPEALCLGLRIQRVSRVGCRRGSRRTG